MLFSFIVVNATVYRTNDTGWLCQVNYTSRQLDQILYSCFLLTWILLISFRDEEICSRGSIDFIYQSRLIWIEIFLTPKLCPLYDGASEYAQSVLIFSRDKHTRPQTTDFLSLALWHDSAAGKFQPLPCPRIKQELSIWKQTVQQVKGSQQKIG